MSCGGGENTAKSSRQTGEEDGDKSKTVFAGVKQVRAYFCVVIQT